MKKVYAVDQNRNLNVELLRIFLTLTVCLHHFRMYSNALPYGGGYVAVDCFFIISGFYLAKHVMGNGSENIENALQYIIQRYIRLFPEYFIAFSISLICRFIMNGVLPGNWMGYVKEMLMIEFWCLDSSERVNPPDWYCGYLLLASVIVFIYMKQIRKYKMPIYITGIMTTALYVYLACYSSHINLYPQYRIGISIAIFRALAGLLMGCLIYLLNYVRCNDSNHEKSKFLYILMVPLGIALSYILLWENRLPYIDYAAIFFFALLFSFAVNMKRKKYNIYFEGVITYLGKMCFTVYLNHYIVAYVFAKYSLFRELDWKITSMLFLAGTFIFSYFIYQLINIIRLLIKTEIRDDKV